MPDWALTLEAAELWGIHPDEVEERTSEFWWSKHLNYQQAKNKASKYWRKKAGLKD